MPNADPNRISVATFDKLASQYAEKYFDLDLYDVYLARFAARLPHGAKVLDVACGPGNVSAFLRRSRPDVCLTGVDLAPGMLEQARSRVPGVQFVLADCRDLASLGQQFAGAAYAFGLSYLPDADARQCLLSLHAVLASQAPLYLSTITGEVAKAGLETGSSGAQAYVAYRPVAQVLDMVRQAGFEIDFHEVVPSPANASHATRDVVLLAHKVCGAGQK